VKTNKTLQDLDMKVNPFKIWLEENKAMAILQQRKLEKKKDDSFPPKPTSSSNLEQKEAIEPSGVSVPEKAGTDIKKSLSNSFAVPPEDTAFTPVSVSSSSSMSTSISKVSENKKPQEQDILQDQEKIKIISTEFRKIIKENPSIESSASTLKTLITFYKPNLSESHQKQLCHNFLIITGIPDDNIRTLAEYLDVAYENTGEVNQQVKTNVGDKLWGIIKDVEPNPEFLQKLNNILDKQTSSLKPSPQGISPIGASPIQTDDRTSNNLISNSDR